MGAPGLVRDASRNQTPQVMTPPTASRPGPFGFRRVPSHFRLGIRYGYPICCVIHFCWDNALGRAAGMTRWKQIAHDRSQSTCVPCGLLHAGGSPFSPHRRLRRMLGFEWALLEPTKEGSRRREFATQGGPCYQASTIEDRQRMSDHGLLEELWWAGSDDGSSSSKLWFTQNN